MRATHTQCGIIKVCCGTLCNLALSDGGARPRQMRFVHCTAARRRTLTGMCNYTNLLANLQLSTCVLRVRFIVPLHRFNTYLYDNWVGWETPTSTDCKKYIGYNVLPMIYAHSPAANCWPINWWACVYYHGRFEQFGR